MQADRASAAGGMTAAGGSISAASSVVATRSDDHKSQHNPAPQRDCISDDESDRQSVSDSPLRSDSRAAAMAGAAAMAAPSAGRRSWAEQLLDAPTLERRSALEQEAQRGAEERSAAAFSSTAAVAVTPASSVPAASAAAAVAHALTAASAPSTSGVDVDASALPPAPRPSPPPPSQAGQLCTECGEAGVPRQVARLGLILLCRGCYKTMSKVAAAERVRSPPARSPPAPRKRTQPVANCNDAAASSDAAIAGPAAAAAAAAPSTAAVPASEEAAAGAVSSSDNCTRCQKRPKSLTAESDEWATLCGSCRRAEKIKRRKSAPSADAMGGAENAEAAAAARRAQQEQDLAFALHDAALAGEGAPTLVKLRHRKSTELFSATQARQLEAEERSRDRKRKLQQERADRAAAAEAAAAESEESSEPVTPRPVRSKRKSARAAEASGVPSQSTHAAASAAAAGASSSATAAARRSARERKTPRKFAVEDRDDSSSGSDSSDSSASVAASVAPARVAAPASASALAAVATASFAAGDASSINFRLPDSATPWQEGDEWPLSLPNTVEMQLNKRDTANALHKLHASTPASLSFPPVPLRVAIIGAGVAGLVAAHQLASRGFHVTIIEARERIGGRVLTWQIPEAPREAPLPRGSKRSAQAARAESAAGSADAAEGGNAASAAVDASATATAAAASPAPLDSSKSMKRAPRARTYPIDLGAAFLHGCDPDGLNPVYEFLLQQPRERRVSLVTKFDTSDAFYRSGGRGEEVAPSRCRRAWDRYERIDAFLLDHSEMLHAETKRQAVRRARKAAAATATSPATAAAAAASAAANGSDGGGGVARQGRSSSSSASGSASASSSATPSERDSSDDGEGEEEEEEELVLSDDMGLDLSFELAMEQLDSAEAEARRGGNGGAGAASLPAVAAVAGAGGQAADSASAATSAPVAASALAHAPAPLALKARSQRAAAAASLHPSCAVPIPAAQQAAERSALAASSRLRALDALDVELLRMISATQHAYVGCLQELSLKDLKNTYEAGVLGGSYKVVSPDRHGYSALILALRALLSRMPQVHFRMGTEVRRVEHALVADARGLHEQVLAARAKRGVVPGGADIPLHASAAAAAATGGAQAVAAPAAGLDEHPPFTRDFDLPAAWLPGAKRKQYFSVAAAAAASEAAPSPAPANDAPIKMELDGPSEQSHAEGVPASASVVAPASGTKHEPEQAVKSEDRPAGKGSKSKSKSKRPSTDQQEDEFGIRPLPSAAADGAGAGGAAPDAPLPICYASCPAPAADLVPTPSSLGVRLHTQTVRFDESAGEVGSVLADRSASVSGTIEAEFALVTCSIGVLQSDLLSFAPDLPASKRAAIASLGMGCENKVILQFPRAFWSASASSSSSSSGGGSGGDKHYLRALHEHRYKFLNLHAFGVRNVLVAQAPPPHSRALSALSDESVVEEVLQVLRGMFGPAVPAPCRARVTRWHEDPYARGSYSFVRRGSSPQSIAELFRASGNLFFAGEGTHPTDGQTVQGAWMSAVQAAKDITKQALSLPSSFHSIAAEPAQKLHIRRSEFAAKRRAAALQAGASDSGSGSDREREDANEAAAARERKEVAAARRDLRRRCRAEKNPELVRVLQRMLIAQRAEEARAAAVQATVPLLDQMEDQVATQQVQSSAMADGANDGDADGGGGADESDYAEEEKRNGSSADDSDFQGMQRGRKAKHKNSKSKAARKSCSSEGAPQARGRKRKQQPAQEQKETSQSKPSTAAAVVEPDSAHKRHRSEHNMPDSAPADADAASSAAAFISSAAAALPVETNPSPLNRAAAASGSIDWSAFDAPAVAVPPLLPPVASAYTAAPYVSANPSMFGAPVAPIHCAPAFVDPRALAQQQAILTQGLQQELAARLQEQHYQLMQQQLQLQQLPYPQQQQQPHLVAPPPASSPFGYAPAPSAPFVAPHAAAAVAPCARAPSPVAPLPLLPPQPVFFDEQPTQAAQMQMNPPATQLQPPVPLLPPSLDFASDNHY